MATIPSSYDFVAQVGPTSGRTVPHLHFHIIPRSVKDKYSMKGVNAVIYMDRPATISKKKMVREINRLKKELASK